MTLQECQQQPRDLIPPPLFITQKGVAKEALMELGRACCSFQWQTFSLGVIPEAVGNQGEQKRMAGACVSSAPGSASHCCIPR